MSKKSIEEILAETLEISKETVNLKSSKKNIPAWDSLSHIHLMVALEEEYEMSISMEEFADLNTVTEIKAYIEKIS